MNSDAAISEMFIAPETLGNICWVDPDFKADELSLLPSLLGPILKAKKEASLARKYLIAINLITFPSKASSPQLLLKDSFFLLNQIPMFGFNCLAASLDSMSDRITPGSKYLEENNLLFPIIHGAIFFDPAFLDGCKITESGEKTKEVTRFLEGFSHQINFEGNPHEALAKLCFGAFIQNYSIDGTMVKDNTKITWLGVVHPKLRSVLDDLFSFSHEPFTIDELESKYTFDNNERKELCNIIERNRFFIKDPLSGKVTFIFKRHLIVPSIRRRFIEHFEEEIVKTDTITSGTMENYTKHYLCYDFEKLYRHKHSKFLNALSFLLQYLKISVGAASLAIDSNINNMYFRKFIYESGSAREINDVVELECSSHPRLFPYTAAKNKKVLLLTDVVNSGATIERAIKLLEKSGAEVKGIFTLIANRNILLEPTYLMINSKQYPIMYFQAQNLISTAPRPSYNRKIFDLSSGKEGTFTKRKARSLDYLHFWEFIQGNCEINERHYVVESSDSYNANNSQVHYEHMIVAKNEIKEEILINDFMDYFESFSKAKQFNLLIIDKHKASSNLCSLIKKVLPFADNSLDCDFNGSLDLVRQHSDKNQNILLVQIGVNTYHGLKRVIDALGINTITSFVFFNRKSAQNIGDVLANEKEVKGKSQLKIYYESNLPFFMEASRKKLRSCPLCKLGMQYVQDIERFNHIDALQSHIKELRDTLPQIEKAPFQKGATR